MRDNKNKKGGGLFGKHAKPDKAERKSRRLTDEDAELELELELSFDDDELIDDSDDEFDVLDEVEPDYDDPDIDEEYDADDGHDGDYADEADAEDGAFDENAGYDDADIAAEHAAREKKRDNGRQTKITLIIIAIILLVIGGGLTVGGYMVTNSTVSFPNLYVDGVSVGSMDKASVKAAIEASDWEERASKPLTVKLMGRSEFEIELYDSGAMLTVDEAAEKAYAFGHSGNWYVNLFEYVKCFMRPMDINDISISYDRDYIRAQCEKGVELFNETLGDGGYEIDKEKSVLRMEKGAGEIEFDLAELTESIVSALASGKKELEYDSIVAQPKMPDFEAIHAELAAEPADAYFTDDNTFTVVDDVEGCDFDVSEAESIWTAAKPAETVEIPIDLTFPEVTGDYLRSLLYRDKIGSMTTYFPKSNENRISNIKLACSKIEGIILYPGDVFSYNDTLGQRTEEAGFKMAGAYSNGEVVEELGGGICQVSSTLYSATLYAYHVSTVQRYPHYFPVDYMEKGYDATVSWPKPDFQFTNERDYPIKIVTHCDEAEKSLTIEIWGTNLDGTYIELTKDTYSYNNTKYPWIMEGYGVQMHRNVFDANGIQIDRIDEVYDVYHTHEATEQIKALDAQAAAAEAAGVAPPA